MFSSSKESTTGKSWLLYLPWLVPAFLIGCAGNGVAEDSVGNGLGGQVVTVSAVQELEETAAEGEQLDGTTQPEPILPAIVTDLTGTEVVVNSVERIIPLDGTVAEVVFALGLGDQVVATDLSATYPPQADALPEIGYQRALTAESIAMYSPTVLLATEIAGPPGVIEDLRRLGFPVVIVPNSSGPEGPPEKIRAVAEALGIPALGDELANRVAQDISEATIANPISRPRVASLYLRGASTQLVLGRNSATHWIIEAAGGESVAEVLGIDSSESISAEGLMVVAPDVILVPSAGLDSVGGPDGLMAIGGLSQTPAGKHRAVAHFADQWLLGNGPRVGSIIEQLATVIDEARQRKEESR